MGSLSRAGTRRLLGVLALSAVVIVVIASVALGAGPGGWDHLGDRGTPGSDSLDLVASALTVTPDALYVGGDFTDAGGIPDADRVATWNGGNWAAVGSSTSRISNGGVLDTVKRPSPEPAPAAAPRRRSQPNAPTEEAPLRVPEPGAIAATFGNGELLWLEDRPGHTVAEPGDGSAEIAAWRRGLRG